MEMKNFTPEEQEEFKKQIEEWKDQYYGAVYVQEIGDVAYIFRGLTKAEYRRANDYYEDDYDRAEYVCRQCVLHPENTDYSLDMAAGVPELLTEEILKVSGFTLSQKELDVKMYQYEQEMTTFDNQIACVIKEAFPDISLETIENWQFEQILWYYSRAKWVLETLRGLTLEREEATIPGLPPAGMR